MTTQRNSDRQQQFLAIANDYKNVVAKVCSIYASPDVAFADLYQEVMINLWTGLDSFQGKAKISSWIYRLAINTCITFIRSNRRHFDGRIGLDDAFDIPAAGDDSVAQLRELYRLISLLSPIDKALITLWLDEKSYDEISEILGISKANVGTRLHRARTRLTELASKS